MNWLLAVKPGARCSFRCQRWRGYFCGQNELMIFERNPASPFQLRIISRFNGLIGNKIPKPLLNKFRRDSTVKGS